MIPSMEDIQGSDCKHKQSLLTENITVNLADEAIEVPYITIPKIYSADDFRVALLPSFIPSTLSCENRYIYIYEIK